VRQDGYDPLKLVESSLVERLWGWLHGFWPFAPGEKDQG
jgi:hypothetical protein